MEAVQAHRSPGGPEAEEWRQGGRTVIFSALAYGAGPLLFLTTASVFIRPTMEATGWSTSEVLISPLVAVLLTTCGPFVGRFVDRRGVRLAILIGIIPYLGLTALFAFLPPNRVTFYLLGTGIGVFGAFGYQIPYCRAVACWFEKGAGKAFGIVGMGGAAMPLVAIPLVTFVIYRLGWQAGYLVLAAFALVLALPSAVFGVQESGQGESTEKIGGQVDVHSRFAGPKVSEILQQPRFWIFAMHIFLVGGAASGFISNMQPILLDGGLDVTVATMITTLFTGGVICGRLGAGVLMDIANRYLVAIPIFLVSLCGALALANIQSLPVALVACAALLTAAGQGAEGDIGAYFILKEFGQEHFGILYAAAGIFGGAGGLLAPFLFTAIRDLTGSYSAAAYLGAGLYAGGALAILLFGVMGRVARQTA